MSVYFGGEKIVIPEKRSKKILSQYWTLTVGFGKFQNSDETIL